MTTEVYLNFTLKVVDEVITMQRHQVLFISEKIKL